jgi:hypothetical protein
MRSRNESGMHVSGNIDMRVGAVDPRLAASLYNEEAQTSLAERILTSLIIL